MISIIVAIDQAGGIGKDNDLLCPISADLKRFKKLTTGHTIVMGRKTFESLPKGALPNRRNVVISTQSDLKLSNCELLSSPDEVLRIAEQERVFIIGGGSIYTYFLPLADELFLTQIKANYEADTFFPTIEWEAWEECAREEHEKDEKAGVAYAFVDMKRKK